MNAPIPDRRRTTVFALLVVIAAPLLLLGPCLLGSRTYVPFDLAQWPPVVTTLTAQQLAEVVDGQNTDPTEIPITFVPELRFAKQELREGRLPQWNPYARTGTPLLATSVVGLLYPLNWVYLIPDDPADGLAIGAYLSFAIGGLLMMGFLRALGLSAVSAAFGALAFMFCGTLYANAHFYQRIAALIWLPGMLWAVLRATEREGTARIPALLGLATCVAMTWLAGFPPYAAPVTLVAGFYAAVRVLPVVRAAGVGEAVRVAGMLGLAGALGFGVAAVQLLPMFAFFPESSRVASTAGTLAAAGFDPAGLLGLVLPDPFGHPHLTPQLPYDTSPLAVWLFSRASWETGLLTYPTNYNFIEYTLFPGTLVLLLAGAAVLHGGSRFRLFAALLAAVLVALSFASSYLAPVHLLPGLSSVPPNRFVGPLCVLLAVLAALGFERTWRGLGPKRWLALCLGGALMSGLLFTGWVFLATHDTESVQQWLRLQIHQSFLARLPDLPLAAVDKYVTSKARVEIAREVLLSNLLYGAIAFLVATLWLVAVPWARRRGWLTPFMLLGAAATIGQLIALAYPVNHGKQLDYPADTAVHQFLREQRDLHRDTGGFTVARGNATPELPFLLPPCTLVPEHIRDLSIYTFVDQHSHKPWRRLWRDAGVDVLFRNRWVTCLPDDERLRHPMLDLFGVRFVLAARPLTNAGQRVGPELKGPHGEFFVYERDSALPRAFVVPAIQTLADEAAVLDALVAPGLDPRAAALVTEADAEVLGAAPAGEAVARERSVLFAWDVADNITLRVGPGPAGYLVLGDSFMSGWTATVNGEPAPIARANVCMRVVAVPAGEVEVRFAYHAPDLVTGAVLTGISLLGLLLLAVWWFSAPRYER